MSLQHKTLKLTILAVIFASFWSINLAYASTDVSGVISTDTTWTAADGPYIVSTLTINSGVTLNIDPGVVVKFQDQNSYIDVDGTLNANGTSADKIYFTSILDDSVGGDTNNDGNSTTPEARSWRNIKFNNSSTGSLSFAVVRYGGETPFTGIYNNGGNISILNSVITDNGDKGILNFSGTLNITSSEIGNQGYGVQIFNGTVDITESNIHDNSLYGVVTQNSSISLTLTDNTFTNNFTAVSVLTGVDFTHSGNTSTGAGINGIEIGGSINGDKTWNVDTMPYVITGLLISSGATLDINPGVIIKFEEGRHIDVEGTLNANGTPDVKIYFTSLLDDSVGGDTNGDGDATIPAGGDWRNIKWNGGTGNLSNIILRYAGYLTFLGDVGLYNNGGNLSISDSVITENGGKGLFQSSGSSTITSSEFSNHAYGIYRGGGAMDISGSSIKNNSQLGILNDGSGTINAQNNYWGDPTGPFHSTANLSGLGNGVSNNVNFIPFLTSDPFGPTPPPAVCTVDCFSNVLFLPGLESSRLYENNGGENQLWEPSGNGDVETLYLNNNGTSINQNIYTRDIVKETNTPIPTGPAGRNIYKSFSEAMNQLVSDQKIKEWQAFAYDWRQSPEDVVSTPQKYDNGTTLSLVPLLQVLETSSKNGKVTIIAHSNGGLVAKALLKKLQDDKTAGTNNLIDNVDVLILIAVPEIGTAKAVSAILHGYDQRILGGWLMDEVHARELGRNMPAAYGLLPSKEYIDRVSASPATFVDNVVPSQVTTKMVQTFGSAINSYSEYKDFLFGNEGRTNPAIGQTKLPIKLSSSLFAQAENLHNSTDTWIPPTSMRVIEVAGWGLNTIASFEYYPKSAACPPGAITCPPYVLDERPRFTSDGDGTVVVPSAQYMSSIGNAEKYWVNLFQYNSSVIVNRDHSDILEVDPILDFLSNTIQNEATNSNYLSTTTPSDSENRFRISVYSPVTLDAYDADGSHTGKICPSNSEFCYIEENISNSSYMQFGEGKYLNLPEDGMSKVKLQGTDIGTFTYESEKVLPNGTSAISSFVSIPVTTQTQAEITINPNTQAPQLKLDVTGDGITDFTLNPSATFDPITYLQIMKVTINSLDLSQAKKTALSNRVDNIIKAIQNGKINKATLKADRFKSALEKKLAKPDPKKPKPKKLSKTDAQLLLDMLNKLLDNIG